jgi:hypothetical protein
MVEAIRQKLADIDSHFWLTPFCPTLIIFFARSLPNPLRWPLTCGMSDVRSEWRGQLREARAAQRGWRRGAESSADGGWKARAARPGKKISSTRAAGRHKRVGPSNRATSYPSNQRKYWILPTTSKKFNQHRKFGDP